MTPLKPVGTFKPIGSLAQKIVDDLAKKIREREENTTGGHGK